MTKPGCNGKCIAPEQSGFLRRAIRDYYAPFITKLPVKIVVIIVFLGMVSVGGYGATQLTENFSLRFFVPSDSPLNTVFDIQDQEYRTGSTSLSVMIDHRPDTTKVFLHDPSVRAEVTKISAVRCSFDACMSVPVMSDRKWCVCIDLII